MHPLILLLVVVSTILLYVLIIAGLVMLRWAAQASDVDFLTKKLPARTIVKNFEAKHAEQEKENQKTNQSPRPRTPQRGQRGYAPKSSP